MGGYATLPADWSKLKTTPWIEKALANFAAFPPQARKKHTESGLTVSATPISRARWAESQRPLVRAAKSDGVRVG